VVARDEVVLEVEGPLVDVDLAEVHQEVEAVVDLGIAAEVEVVVVLFLVAEEDPGEALGREEAALEGEDEKLILSASKHLKELGRPGKRKHNVSKLTGCAMRLTLFFTASTKTKQPVN
jgi:hypothetical protein